MSASDFRHDINGLRALSVALVVAYHLHLRGSDGGFIGVDVFFVISGYLMTKIVWDGLSRDTFSYWKFVCARAARIWPALAAMVVVLLLLGAFLLPPFDLKILADQSIQALLFWSNQFFHDRAGYNTRSADTHWLLHTWSLSVEWQFYVLYPFALIGAAKLWRWLRPGAPATDARRWVIASMAALFILSCAHWAVQSRAGAQSAFFLLPARAWEMLAGGLVFFLPAYRGAHGRLMQAAVSHAGLALLVGSALLIGVRHLHPVGIGPVLALPVLGTAMVLWAKHQGNVFLNNPVARHIGLWSYSIYLWHWPFIVALRMTDVFFDAPLAGNLLVVVGAVLCGGLSYRWVESMAVAPRARSTWRMVRKPLSAMALAAAATTVVAATEGLEFRNGGRPDFYRGYWASIKPLYFPDECSNFQKTAADTKPCTVDKGSAQRILVIGDSHAEHLYPWFVAHSQVSVDFFTQAECPPVPRFERLQRGYHCMDYASAAWQKAASPEYDTLIVAARWAGVGLDGAPYCHQAQGGARCSPSSVPVKQALIRAELKSATEALLALGKTVVMVAATPEARVRVPERIARENFWHGRTRLAIDERSVAGLAGWLTPLFEALIPQRGFHLVSLNDKLCSGSVCEVYDTQLQRPIYVDESHFDPVWIARNGGVFTPFVQTR